MAKYDRMTDTQKEDAYAFRLEGQSYREIQESLTEKHGWSPSYVAIRKNLKKIHFGEEDEEIKIWGAGWPDDPHEIHYLLQLIAFQRGSHHDRELPEYIDRDWWKIFGEMEAPDTPVTIEGTYVYPAVFRDIGPMTVREARWGKRLRITLGPLEDNLDLARHWYYIRKYARSDKTSKLTGRPMSTKDLDYDVMSQRWVNHNKSDVRRLYSIRDFWEKLEEFKVNDSLDDAIQILLSVRNLWDAQDPAYKIHFISAERWLEQNLGEDWRDEITKYNVLEQWDPVMVSFGEYALQEEDWPDVGHFQNGSNSY